MLSAIICRLKWVAEAYLQVSGLPQTTVGRGGTVWLVQVNEGIMETHVFRSLPQAAWGRGGGNTQGVYMGLCS